MNKQKLRKGFNVRCWGLKFHHRLFSFVSEIQSKRQERKRRSTANPAYSGLFEPEVCLPVIVSINNVNFMAMFIFKHLVFCFSVQTTCLQLHEQCDFPVGER